jgi:hypothetical protein
VCFRKMQSEWLRRDCAHRSGLGTHVGRYMEAIHFLAWPSRRKFSILDWAG